MCSPILSRLLWFVGFVLAALGLVLCNQGIQIGWDSVGGDQNLLWFMRYATIIPGCVGAFTYLGTVLNNRGYFFMSLGLVSSVFGYLTWLADIARFNYDSNVLSSSQQMAWKQILVGSIFSITGAVIELFSSFPHGLRWGEELTDTSHRSSWQTVYMVFSSAVFLVGEICVWSGQSVQVNANYDSVQAFVLPHQEVIVFAILAVLSYFLANTAIDSAVCFTLAWQFTQMLLACIYQVPTLPGVNDRDLVRGGFGVVAVGLFLLEFGVLYDSQPRLKLYRPDGGNRSGAGAGAGADKQVATLTTTSSDGDTLSVPVVVRRPSTHLEVVQVADK